MNARKRALYSQAKIAQYEAEIQSTYHCRSCRTIFSISHRLVGVHDALQFWNRLFRFKYSGNFRIIWRSWIAFEGCNAREEKFSFSSFNCHGDEWTMYDCLH